MCESDTSYIYSEEQLIVLCREWQQRLRLECWEVALRIARQRDFDLKNAQGECCYTKETALATIKILDPTDYPQSPFKYDMEIVLVHELLHLHFCMFDKTEYGSLDETMMERSIDHIAKALVKLKRQSGLKAENAVMRGRYP
ncbi:hypothetical protein [Acetonema longum]|uniref:SprT-like domain-containing protein n=1 Tax=Acetonema longum DSM 6540 TaxID=1009370 RepID=F7NK65_9FIRM|nr:hypothetical protein [Acetonema longum]EGO63506.1 hypothetical protein ALO_12391 [Acetonema longum DSM 6540]